MKRLVVIAFTGLLAAVVAWCPFLFPSARKTVDAGLIGERKLPGTVEICRMAQPSLGFAQPMAEREADARIEEYAQRLLALSDDATGGIARERLFSAWLEKEPVAAAAWVRGMVEDPRFGQLLTAFLAAWAPRDPTGAASWYFDLPASAGNDVNLRELVRAMAGHDPAVAAEWCMALKDPAMQQDTLHAVLQGWCARDFTGAIPWIEALPAGPQNDRVLLDVATELSAFDNSHALALIGAVDDQAARREATAGIVRQWARHAPPEALAWIGVSTPQSERALLLAAYRSGAAEAAGNSGP